MKCIVITHGAEKLTIVIVRIHVEVGHLPTSDSSIQTAAVAGFSLLAHGQRQNGSTGQKQREASVHLCVRDRFVHNVCICTQTHLCALNV